MLIIKRRPIHETLANRRRCRGTDDHAGRMRAKSAYVPTQAAGNPAAAQTQIQGPAVTGSVNIRQRIALPPDAVLTVTLSDASLADAPSKVIAQRAVRTEGQQAPFSFTLPYNPSDIQPNARIILSAAVTVKGRLMFITDTIQKWSTATAPVPICCWFRFRVCRFRLRQPPCSNLTAVQQDEINSLCASAKGCFVTSASRSDRNRPCCAGRK